MMDPLDTQTLDLVAACKQPLSAAERQRKRRAKVALERAAGLRVNLSLAGPELAVLGVAVREFCERWERVPSKQAAGQALACVLPESNLADVFPGDSAWLPDIAQQQEKGGGWVAHNRAQVEVLYQRSPLTYRQTPHGQPLVDELIRPGDYVWSSYGSGPYQVREVKPHHCDGMLTFTLVLRMLDGRKGDGWISECVAIDGRILKLFANNTDEIFYQKPDATMIPAPAMQVLEEQRRASREALKRFELEHELAEAQKKVRALEKRLRAAGIKDDGAA